MPMPMLMPMLREKRDPVADAIETLRATGLSADMILARLTGDNVVPMTRGAA